MKSLYKKNIIFKAVFIMICACIGFFAHSNAMIADAFFCLVLTTFSFREKSLPRVIFAWALTVLGAAMCWITFSSIQTSVLEIGLEDAPQLWALPAVAVVFIAKIILVFAASDTEKTDENKAKLTEISKIYKFSVIITASVLVGLFASYITDFFIEGAVAFAVSFIAFVTAGKTAVTSVKKEKKPAAETEAGTENKEEEQNEEQAKEQQQEKEEIQDDEAN